MARKPPTPEVPGEEPQTEGDASQEDAVQEAGQAQAEPAPARKPPPAPAAQHPDQDEIDPAKIPYGKAIMTKQGLVCSTQEDPQRTASRPR